MYTNYIYIYLHAGMENIMLRISDQIRNYLLLWDSNINHQ